MSIKSKIASLLLISTLLLIPAKSAFAIGPSTPGSGGNGLRVSPVRTDLTIAAGKSQIVNISLTNVTSSPSTVKVIINDFGASKDESGNPAIVLDPNQYAQSHSLKRFITPIGNYTIAPGQTAQIPVSINIPANAAGGGYFGAIRFVPAKLANGPDVNISLAGSVGSLILVKVPGDFKELMIIKSFDVRKKDSPSTFFTTNKNLNLTARLENKGNVQEQPFGKVFVKNSKGKFIYETEFNNTIPRGNVLPDSIRKFPVPLKNIGSFGKYTVEGSFGYGSTGQLVSASTTFYVVPTWMIITFFAVVALIVFLIFGLPRIIRAYNQRVLRNARRN